jgi:hypothetical protein
VNLFISSLWSVNSFIIALINELQYFFSLISELLYHRSDQWTSIFLLSDQWTSVFLHSDQWTSLFLHYELYHIMQYFYSLNNISCISSFWMQALFNKRKLGLAMNWLCIMRIADESHLLLCGIEGNRDSSALYRYTTSLSPHNITHGANKRTIGVTVCGEFCMISDMSHA